MAKSLSGDIANFFRNQGCVIVSTITKDGVVHNACKGIVQISGEGKIYLSDLYRGNTYANLKSNPNISITAIDEHKFKGYCLQGKAKIVTVDEVPSHLLKAWEDRIASRITQRVLKNIAGEKGHPQHPEALLPRPTYLIEIEVEEIIDLTPQHLK